MNRTILHVQASLPTMVQYFTLSPTSSKSVILLKFVAQFISFLYPLGVTTCVRQSLIQNLIQNLSPNRCCQDDVASRQIGICSYEENKSTCSPRQSRDLPPLCCGRTGGRGTPVPAAVALLAAVAASEAAFSPKPAVGVNFSGQCTAVCSEPCRLPTAPSVWAT